MLRQMLNMRHGLGFFDEMHLFVILERKRGFPEPTSLLIETLPFAYEISLTRLLLIAGYSPWRFSMRR